MKFMFPEKFRLVSLLTILAVIFTVSFDSAAQTRKPADKKAAAKKAVATKVAKPGASAPTSSRAGEPGPNVKQLRSDWKKDGNHINSPAFDAMLRARLRGK